MKYAYSYSRFSDYQVCPFYFKCRHIDRLPGERKDILIQGSVLHNLLGLYTLKCYEEGKTNLFDKWEDIADEGLAKENISNDMEEQIKNDFKAYVEANEIEIGSLAGVEERIALDEGWKPTRWKEGKFRGIIDKLYIAGDCAKVSDYKTGYSMKPDTFQLEVYAWLLSKVYPQLNYFEVQLDFTRFSWRKEWDIKKEALPGIEKKIIRRIKQIEEETKFKPTVNSRCAECEYWSFCPAMKKAKIEKMPNTKTGARELLEQVITKKKEYKEVEKLLKQYCEKAGKVVVKDMKAEIAAIITPEWDTGEVLEYCNEKRIAFTDLFKIDGRKVEKLGIPKEFSEPKISTRFKLKKIKEGK